MADGEKAVAQASAHEDFVVAIVGRPNVGKSTLFNRLIGNRRAIVHSSPGVTRDRMTGRWQLSRKAIEVIDTGGLVPGEDPVGINTQVLFAVDESDLLLFVVDGREGLTGADRSVIDEIRPRGRDILVVVNKGDTRAAQAGFGEFYELGFDNVLLVSAEHGTGISDLCDAVEERVPESAQRPQDELSAIAIVGRPNVGKSSLLNRLTGRERSLVSPIAGTTRDPVDQVLERPDARSYRLVDTAGIRRRSQVSDAPEGLAVMMARRQIGRADLAVLTIDAAAGITSGDLAIAGAIWSLGRPAVIVVNKWDLLNEERREQLDHDWLRLEEILYNPRRVNTSAESGRGIDKILLAVDDVLARLEQEISTSEVNRLLEQSVQRHAAPSERGRPWRFYYATQVNTLPPTFMLFANRILKHQDPYRRYLENRLREGLGLDGIPIRLVIRQRTEKTREP